MLHMAPLMYLSQKKHIHKLMKMRYSRAGEFTCKIDESWYNQDSFLFVQWFNDVDEIPTGIHT